MKAVLLMNDVYIHEHSIAHLKFTAHWQDETGTHMAEHHVEKFHVWRDMDLLPQALMKDILHQPVGKGKSHCFAAGEIVPEWQPGQLVTVPLDHFTGRFINGQKIQPRAGRFYPGGMIAGVKGIYSENRLPVRIVEIKENHLVVDYNHALSSRDLSLEVEIIEIFPPADEHGGRCTDVIYEWLANGPGMQLPYNNTVTEFFVEGSFDRIDEADDSYFYQQERKVHHLDANARRTIGDLYSDLIAPGSRVLDLMSSWESHLPVAIKDLKVSGLGLNEAELRANAQLENYIIHDLNISPVLPYEDESFDAVICTASVEYLTRPLNVFSELRRIIKPGGHCIMTFSNRWFPVKAIALWSELHEFERMGLVMEYFRNSGWRGKINTFSSRGLMRPYDDPHFVRTPVSDPVYAVWVQK